MGAHAAAQGLADVGDEHGVGGAGGDRGGVAQPGVLEGVVGGVPGARNAGQRAPEPRLAADPGRDRLSGSVTATVSLSASLSPAAGHAAGERVAGVGEGDGVGGCGRERDGVAVAQPLVGDGVRGAALVVPSAARARTAPPMRGAPETPGARGSPAVAGR